MIVACVILLLMLGSLKITDCWWLLPTAFTGSPYAVVAEGVGAIV